MKLNKRYSLLVERWLKKHNSELDVEAHWDDALTYSENIYKRDVDNVAKMLLNKECKKHKVLMW